ncbi:hypothetical protein P0D72_17810 [Paraburkholderia sediminicola]|uniref:hypothetical protein n=1 Tax=Paraburkholderia sediminicola TaxID=458836 RepID=UPI0038B94C59
MIARAVYRDQIVATRELADLLRQQVHITQAQVEAGASAYAAVLTLENEWKRRCMWQVSRGDAARRGYY